MEIGSNSGASALSHPARPFNPAAWLALYVELGGGYTVNCAGVCLHWPRHMSGLERTALVAHEMPLKSDRSKQEAVRDYLASICITETGIC